MIRIQRDTAPPAISVFTKATANLSNGQKCTRARRELESAIAFFTDPAKFKNDVKLTKESFDFKVYKDRALAKALEKVFGGKCAYCESRFAHVTPKDVEHFRPKSEIEIKNVAALSPGYFWLAGEWTNLLVSCPDCNRRREHEVPGQSAAVKLGKQAQFPLKNEAGRVRLHTGNVAAEEPVRLLLDPCSDDPELHLTFDDDGLVHARTDTAGQPSDKGSISIDVYALQRKELVEERLRVLDDVKFQLDMLRDLVAELADAPSPEAKREQIRKVKEHLARSLAKNAPFLGMTRDYLRRAKAAGDFNDLIKNGIDPETLINQQ